MQQFDNFPDQAHLLDELNRLRETVRAAQLGKDAFLATLAHELRNPLAPIRNALHLLRITNNDPATLIQARDIMERQVRQMVRLIDDLLDLSRLSRGKIELKKEMIEVKEVVQMALESSRPALDSAGTVFQVSLPEETLHVWADPMRLAQALANLLNNAAKYTEAGGQVQLTVTQESGSVVFRVRDDGAGIPADMLPHVFDMFCQIDRALNRAQGGLGIGLSVVRGLVRLHGGEVEASSNGLGQGSEFVMRLPQ
jgi:signal transduction histidine kinase